MRHCIRLSCVQVATYLIVCFLTFWETIRVFFPNHCSSELHSAIRPVTHQLWSWTMARDPLRMESIYPWRSPEGKLQKKNRNCYVKGWHVRWQWSMAKSRRNRSALWGWLLSIPSGSIKHFLSGVSTKHADVHFGFLSKGIVFETKEPWDHLQWDFESRKV